MYWLYVLRCSNNYFYVGKSNKLYTEIAQHLDEQFYETYVNKPISISAIYPSASFNRYLQIVRLFEQGKSLNEEFNDLIDNFNIRDSPSFSREEDVHFLENCFFNNIDHPRCCCGIPCDIKKSINGNLYYFCARKNIWDSLSEEFSEYLITDQPCDFYQIYWILSPSVINKKIKEK